jgi:integrase
MYRKSQAWGALALSTRRKREYILAEIERALGESSLAAWGRAEVVAGRDKRAATPGMAQHFVVTLRGLFGYLLEAGLVRSDPTEGVKYAKASSDDGFAVWTHDDAAAFCARWPLGTRERVAFEVLAGTGLRRGDAVRVGRPHVRDGVIRLTTEKTGERVAVAIGADLAAAIEAGPCGDSYLWRRARGGNRQERAWAPQVRRDAPCGGRVERRRT